MKEKHSIACIVFDKNRILIAHRNPIGQMGGKWEFPGGKIEEGESHKEAIIREFQEEFGVTVTVGDFITEARFEHNDTSFCLHAYRVNVPHTGEKEAYKLTEHTGYIWTTLDSIRGLNFVDSDLLIYPKVIEYAKNHNIV